MIKLLFRLVILAVVVVGGLMLTGNILLGKVLGAVVGAPVAIGRIQADFVQQRFGLYDFQIRNPRGFDEKNLATIPEIFIHLDLASIMRNEIHVREVRLRVDQVTVEKNREGKINAGEIGALKKKEKPADAKAPQPGAEKPEAKEKAKPGPKIVIDKVLLSIGRARYVDNSAGKREVREFAVNIHESVLTNVTDPVQITQQIVVKTLQKIGLNALLPNLDQFAIGLGPQISAKAEEFKQVLSDWKDKVTS